MEGAQEVGVEAPLEKSELAWEEGGPDELETESTS